MTRRNYGSGAYVYAFLINNSIRYIGKGRQDRVARHLAEAKRNLDQIALSKFPQMTRLQRGLCKSISEGHEITIIIIRSNLSDEDAWSLERTLIAAYGRKKIDQGGILWNLSAGGDGQTSERALYEAAVVKERGGSRKGKKGKPHTEASKKRISEGILRAYAETDAIKKQAARRLGRKASAEHAKSISVALTGRPKSAEHRRNLAASKIGHIRTLRSREKQGRTLSIYCNTEAGREHMRKASAAAHAKRAELKASACRLQSKSGETI